MQLRIIHIPVIFVPNSIYLIPLLSYLSFLKHLMPINQKINEVIMIRVLIPKIF